MIVSEHQCQLTNLGSQNPGKQIRVKLESLQHLLSLLNLPKPGAMVLSRNLLGHPLLSLMAYGAMMPVMTTSRVVKKRNKSRRRRTSSSASAGVTDSSFEEAQPTFTVLGELIGARGASGTSYSQVSCSNPDADGHDHETNQKFNEACHRTIMDFLAWAAFPLTSSLVYLNLN